MKRLMLPSSRMPAIRTSIGWSVGLRSATVGLVSPFVAVALGSGFPVGLGPALSSGAMSSVPDGCTLNLFLLSFSLTW
jgi:hypothetical protein